MMGITFPCGVAIRIYRVTLRGLPMRLLQGKYSHEYIWNKSV